MLQFRVMARMLEHVNKWSTTTLFWAAADQLQTGKDSQPVNPDELKQQLKKVLFPPLHAHTELMDPPKS